MTAKFTMAAGTLLILSVGIILCAGPGFGQTPVSQPGSPTLVSQRIGVAEPQTAQTKQTDVDVDEDDPNSLLWAMQRAGHESGWRRGQEIYYMRCWMCHNEYTIAADTSPPAPSLRDLFKRPLVGGQPMNDQNVAAYIRRGSARMPAYSAAVLSNADLSDLITYLREKCGTFSSGGGCFDEHNPPPNPRYRAK